jgi:hypothetical protein
VRVIPAPKAACDIYIVSRNVNLHRGSVRAAWRPPETADTGMPGVPLDKNSKSTTQELTRRPGG